MLYIVKVKGSGDTVAICSRKEDALAFLAGQKVDKLTYEIEEVSK